jgi:hypothetical protein
MYAWSRLVHCYFWRFWRASGGYQLPLVHGLGKKRFGMTKKRKASGGFFQKVFAVLGAGLALSGL